MLMVAVSLAGSNVGIIPVPGSVMLTETVKLSVPSTRLSSKTSAKTDIVLPSLEPLSNVKCFYLERSLQLVEDQLYPL